VRSFACITKCCHFCDLNLQPSSITFCYYYCAEEHCVFSPCWKKKNDVAKWDKQALPLLPVRLVRKHQSREISSLRCHCLLHFVLCLVNFPVKNYRYHSQHWQRSWSTLSCCFILSKWWDPRVNCNALFCTLRKTGKTLSKTLKMDSPMLLLMIATEQLLQVWNIKSIQRTIRFFDKKHIARWLPFPYIFFKTHNLPATPCEMVPRTTPHMWLYVNDTFEVWCCLLTPTLLSVKPQKQTVIIRHKQTNGAMIISTTVARRDKVMKILGNHFC